MASRWTHWTIWCRRAMVILAALALSACVASSGPRSGALRVVGADIVASPASYTQSCGATQTFRYTATLTANDGNPGGRVYYRWHIGFTTVEGDVTFAPGDTTQQLSRTVTTEVQPDAEPLLVATIETTAPNATSSPPIAVPLSCSAALQIVSADVMVSPSSVGCGPQIVGFAAVLAATEGNPGGAVRYTWHFLDGSTQSGHVTFAPGQINATIAVAPTYRVISGRQPSALESGSPPGGSPAGIFPTWSPLPTPRPTRTPRPKPTPTPVRPRPTPSPGPPGTPVAADQIGAWLSVEAPNTLQSSTVTAATGC